MTAAVLEKFGIRAGIRDDGVSVDAGELTPPDRIDIETDWSAASYFYELALLLPGVDIPLRRLSAAEGLLQGDSACAGIFGLLGVETLRNEDGSACLNCDGEKLRLFREMEGPLQLDLNATPDLVPAIAVGLCFAGVRYSLTGIGHLRHKESNRLQAIANELERVGYRVDVGEGSLSWRGDRTPVGENETIYTYSDHRIAMAFAPAAVKVPYLSIEDPGVVDKSFPGFWDALEGLGFRLKRFGGDASGRRRYKR